ncbi:MAG: hypothetical protein QM692_18725 [Thermomicrobiales bacterium]
MSAAAAAPYASLPTPRSRLIGRAAECEAGRALLLDEVAPLLTRTGPGGVGKTRLALAIAAEVAARFADGVVWVDLAPVSEPLDVAAAVAAALAAVTGQPLAEARLLGVADALNAREPFAAARLSYDRTLTASAQELLARYLAPPVLAREQQTAAGYTIEQAVALARDTGQTVLGTRRVADI